MSVVEKRRGRKVSERKRKMRVSELRETQGRRKKRENG